jgi:16S rRNA C967 or C1407 C5-methylase (RsmB/RsmF family)
VNKILEENGNFELVDLKNFKQANNFHCGLTEETKKCLRICRKCNNIDGFFVAIFKRK